MPTDAARAYRAIKEKIITLELAPGSVIQDGELMQELQLGRTPIREALKLLEAEKLVMTVPRRGIFVASISITDLQQIIEVRLELEGLAMRLACERANAEDLARLGKYLERLAGDEMRSLPTRERLELDREIHLALTRAAHNTFLTVEVERFYDLARRLWYYTLGRVRPSEVNLQSHQEIIQAVLRRDAAEAERLMRQHILEFQQTVKEVI
ncbi:MAG: GntR family transcriptional regulator [Anaerolineae bacterium]|nr:GntR family transcriptional regulator [Anaerolineae bacterium]